MLVTLNLYYDTGSDRLVKVDLTIFSCCLFYIFYKEKSEVRLVWREYGMILEQPTSTQSSLRATQVLDRLLSLCHKCPPATCQG